MYQLLGVPGEKVEVRIIKPTGVKRVRVANEPVSGPRWTLALRGTRRAPSRLARVKVEELERGSRFGSGLKGCFHLTVSPREKARVCVCVDVLAVRKGVFAQMDPSPVDRFESYGRVVQRADKTTGFGKKPSDAHKRLALLFPVYDLREGVKGDEDQIERAL